MEPDGPGPAGPLVFHAACAARGEEGVLMLGASGSGKSDLLLRLLDRGFALVADERVLVENGLARPDPRLAGLVEVRGIGLLRLGFRSMVRLALVLALDDAAGGPIERLPAPCDHPVLGLPMLRFDPRGASAALRVEIALDCLAGRTRLLEGGLPGEEPWPGEEP